MHRQCELLRPAAVLRRHVWAWKDNPYGMFVDWIPRVSCEVYAVDSQSR